jgi:hypothetical protein
MTRRPRVRTIEQLVTHFWLAIDVGKPDDCWPWTGYQERGYGRYSIDGRMRFAHDLALEWSTGEPRPDGLDTCHSCNNSICVNPAHLRYDTRQSNVDDMMRAGTHRVTNRKLSDDDVVIIRERAHAGAAGGLLASQYGVSESVISQIIRGRKRPHAGGPIRSIHGNNKEAHSGR